MSIAIFDADGVCLAIGSLSVPDMAHDYQAEVEPPARPTDLWFDKQAKKAKRSKLIDPAEVLGIAVCVAVGEPIKVKIPAQCVLEINGVRARKTVSIDISSPQRILVEMKGRLRGEMQMEVRSYVEERRATYPPIADQLDALWKTATFPDGSPAAVMQEEIMAVKANHPKDPGQ